MLQEQDLTYVVDFTVEVPVDLWENAELTFNRDGWSFYDADYVSESDGIVTASIKLESESFWSTVERASSRYVYVNSSENFTDPSIMFDDYKAIEIKSELYKVREYGI